MKQWLRFFLSSLLVTWFEVSAHDTADRLYGHLLKELVRVNENRMDTIAKLSKPTKFDFAKTLQRTLENPTQLKVKRDPVVVLVLDLPSDSIGKLDEEKIEVEGRNEYAIEDVFSNNAYPEKRLSEKINSQFKKLLRSDWLKACRKSAEKKCQQACKDSIQNVCVEDSCKRNMKNKFKKECKKSCKNEFGPESDSEENDYEDCAGRSSCKNCQNKTPCN